MGTRIQELLQDYYEFTDLSLATGVDITNLEGVEKKFAGSPAKIILHMAAKTDVDACEDDRILGEEGSAWLINVIGTENIVNKAEQYGKRVIYVSTDFVFDGTKDSYDEHDVPNPVNWYGRTKYEGEQIVARAKVNSTIVRLAYPYRAKFAEKMDFVRRILSELEKTGKVYGLVDHVFTPTFIDDIAAAIKILIEKDLAGIYHVVGSLDLPVIDAVRLIAEIFSLKGQIEPVKRSEYFKDRAFRPSKLALNNDKIKKLGVSMKTFDEGLKIMKLQIGEDK